jgi:hypothetical protein
MSSVVISGDTSGQVTLAAPAVAGTSTLTLQAATATSSVNTLGTAVASTSGTSIDYTGLPSWIKRITVQFQGVSTNGSSVIQVQLGTGGTPTYTTTGYLGSSLASTSGSAPLINLFTSGMAIGADGTASFTKHGTLVITNISGNNWVGNGNGANSEVARVWTCGSSIALGAALTAVRITTVNGTDTFDAGTVNILYEG